MVRRVQVAEIKMEQVAALAVVVQHKVQPLQLVALEPLVKETLVLVTVVSVQVLTAWVVAVALVEPLQHPQQTRHSPVVLV